MQAKKVTPAMLRVLQYAENAGGSFTFWESGAFARHTLARCRNAGLMEAIDPPGPIGAIRFALTAAGRAALAPPPPMKG